MAIDLSCSGCSTRLTVPDSAAGKAAKCPRCGAIVPVPGVVEATLVSHPPEPEPQPTRGKDEPPRKRHGRNDDADDGDDDRPRTRRRDDADDEARPRKRPKRVGSGGPSIGLIFGVLAGLLVLGAAGVGVYFIVAKKSTSTKETADAAKGEPGKADHPKSDLPRIDAPNIETPRPGRPTLPAGWVEFRHPDGVYRVYVPARPNRDPMSFVTLKLNVPLKPQEARESIHGTALADGNGVAVKMKVLLFHPNEQAIFDRMVHGKMESAYGITITDSHTLTWCGHPTVEADIEVPDPTSTSQPPRRGYETSRIMVAPGRMYTMGIVRMDRQPNAAERAAFFDSFVPGK